MRYNDKTDIHPMQRKVSMSARAKEGKWISFGRQKKRKSSLRDKRGNTNPRG